MAGLVEMRLERVRMSFEYAGVTSIHRAKTPPYASMPCVQIVLTTYRIARPSLLLALKFRYLCTELPGRIVELNRVGPSD